MTELKVRRSYFWMVCIIMLSALFCGFFVSSEAYKNIWLLPGTMSIVLLICNNTVKEISSFITFRIVIIIELVRYVIIPVFMVASNFYNSTYYPDPSDKAANMALLLMCYELIVEFLTLSFVCRLLRRSLLKAKTVEPRYARTNIIVITALVLIAFSFYKCVVSNLSIRISFFMFSLPSTDRIFTGGENLLQCSFALLYFVFALPLLRRLSLSKPPIITFIALSGIWIGISFGDARMMYIVKAVTVICFVYLFAPIKLSKKISAALFVVAFVSVLAMTIMDENASHGIFFFTGNSYEKSTYAYTLQKYFAGPYNVAKSIDLAGTLNFNSYLDNLEQLLTDMTANVYPLYDYAETDSTKVLFNYHLYGTYEKATQIIPIVGQGYIYFGFVFSFIPMIVIIILLYKFEAKRMELGSSNSIMCLLLVYACAYLAFFRMYNVIIICGFLFNILLYGYIICFVQDKFNIGLNKWSKK